MRALALTLSLLAWLPDPARADPWRSPTDCAAALRARKTLPLAAGQVRVATWNLDGFPGTLPGAPPKAPGRDTAWLACALAWLQAEVVALQGIGTGRPADVALRQAITALGRLTQSRWELKLDSCTGKGQQRVGLLWNTRRLKATKLVVESLLNPHRKTCHLGQRPGVRGYFKAPGGLDFHLFSVHLPEGAQMSAFSLRDKVVDNLKEVYQAAQRAEPDPDLLLAGVWNMVGCPACPNASTPEQALTRMIQRLTALDPSFRVYPSNLSCSRLGGGDGDLVSQFVSSRGFVELQRSNVRVRGVCEALSCTAPGANAALVPALVGLSRHCPVTLDIPDRDEDPKREELGGYVEGSQGDRGADGAVPLKLSVEQIKAVLEKQKPALRRACGREGSAYITLTITGATGKVLTATGPKGTKPCVLRIMKQAVFPKFKTSATELEVPVVW